MDFQEIAERNGFSRERLKEIYWQVVQEGMPDANHPDMIDVKVKEVLLDSPAKEELFIRCNNQFEAALKHTLVCVAIAKDPEAYERMFRESPYKVLGEEGAYTPHVSAVTRWPGFEFRNRVLKEAGATLQPSFGDAKKSFDGIVVTAENAHLVSEDMIGGALDFWGCIITNGGSVLTYDVGGLYAGPLMAGKLNAGYRFADHEFAEHMQIFLIESRKLGEILKALKKGIGAIAKRNKGVLVHLEDIKGIDLMETALPIMKGEKNIYVFSDDQLYTGLMATAPLGLFLRKYFSQGKIGIINGLGAAGEGVRKALMHVGLDVPVICTDSRGVIHKGRPDSASLPKFKQEAAIDLRAYGIDSAREVYLGEVLGKIPADKIAFFYETSGRGKYFRDNPQLLKPLSDRSSPIFFALLSNPAVESSDAMRQVLSFFDLDKVSLVSGSPPELIYNAISDKKGLCDYPHFKKLSHPAQANNIIFFPAAACTIGRLVIDGKIDCTDRDEIRRAHNAAYDGIARMTAGEGLLAPVDQLLVPGGYFDSIRRSILKEFNHMEKVSVEQF